jgi:uncharacterized membrane protein YbhN (UPF0104 family)
MNSGGWQRRAKRGAVAALRLGVMVGAIAYLGRGIAWADVAKILRGASLPLLAAVTALNAAMMAAKSWRLQLLLERRPSFAASFLAKLTTSALNNVTPFRGGDVARIWMLERHAGITKAVAAVVALLEHIFDLVALSILATFAARLFPAQHWAAVAAPIVFLVTGTGLVLLRRAATGAGTGAAPPPPASRPAGMRGRLRALGAHLAPGVRALADGGILRTSLALSFLGWAIESVMVALTARAIGLSITPPLAIVVLLGLNAALALPSAPASAGAFEAGVTLVLILAGVPKGQAVAFAVLYHLVQVVPVTAAGVAVISRVGFTLRGLAAREARPAQATPGTP